MSRIDIIGGGPGGAFASRLLKLAHPQAEVTLHDTLLPADTFGFGVGLSVSTQNNLGNSDPETFRLIAAASHTGHGLQLHSGGGVERIAGSGQVAIARSRLLQILYRQAERAGVRVSAGARVDAFDRDADLVIAADGVSSATRTREAKAFGVRETIGRQKFIWCGADTALPDGLFSPAESEFGVFTTHAYPYARDRSTFLVETDEQVWRAAGFDRDMSHLAPGQSDEEARQFLETVFKEHLDGARLLSNNSRWTQFRTIHCDRWHHRNITLLGDAAHTAHYSVGSGTKLAMEDAIALTESLKNYSGELAAALESYRASRAASVRQLQYLARRSELWWESYVDRMELSPAQMVVSFFTRAGNVSLESLRQREPQVVERAMTAYADGVTDEDPVAWAIAQPLDHHGRTIPTRDAADADLDLMRVECDIDDPRSAQAAAFIDAALAAVADRQTDGVELVGDAAPHAVRHRLDIAEQIRFRSSALTAVRAPAAMAMDLAAALIAERIDLVSLA